ncbi:hypothetical protein [Borrelia duttonii]|uniref:ORFk-like protein, lipoprotein n=1 Tax=Borrelia duttonii (strain Ly) TaxID=412419 RepID=B5RPD9_BORDL|nr:ORFk-like protein, lipoprotein [Borrelia duttonii Ly]
MNKNKSILILCIILFLYGCNANKTPAQANGDASQITRSTDESPLQKINSDTEEKNRFDLLMYGLGIAQKNLKIKYKDDAKYLVSINKYEIFRTWILDKSQIQKQKELSKAFINAYNCLDKKVKTLSNHMTIMQYVENAFAEYLYNEYKTNSKYDARLYGNKTGGFPANHVSSFFESLIHTLIKDHDTNEKKFQIMRDILEDKNSRIYKNISKLLTD